jgi:hypothetical protein
MTMTTRDKHETGPPADDGSRRFFELVNWKKAQPRMKGKDNPWMKLYTSLLDHDAFAALDDAARNLLICLWLYAARSGMHVFPADPAWLTRRIPILSGPPDLRPLLDAVDAYGNPSPFVRYCEAPKPKKPRRRTPAGGSKKEQGEESRVEESRGEESRGDSQGAGARVQREDGREEREKKRRGETPDGQADRQSSETTDRPEPADPAGPDTGSAENQAGLDQQGRAILVPRDLDTAPGSDNGASGHRRLRYPMSEAVYDRFDIQIARRVFFALRLPGDPDNGARDETASFASVWHEIAARASVRGPPELVDELARRAVRVAERIARSETARNPSKVWISTIRKIAKGKF